MKFSRRAMIIGLYVAGLLFWAWYFRLGDFSVAHGDWAKEFVYYNHLGTALREGTLPLYTGIELQRTGRMLANPEVSLAPTALVLLFTGPKKFLFVHVLVVYSVGFLGLVRFAGARNLSAAVMLLLFGGWMLNGHLLAHLSAGHSMWSGCLLMPWLLVALERIDSWPREKYAAVAGVPLVLGGMLLVGSFHLVSWLILFLMFVAALRGRAGIPLWIALLLTFVIGTFRFLPAAAVFGKSGQIMFDGYPQPIYFLRCLLLPMEYVPAVPPPGAPRGVVLGNWEYTLHIGVVATIALVAVMKRCWMKGNDLNRAMMAAGWIVLLLSFSWFYLPVAMSPIPILNAQRVPSRFAFVSLITMFFVAAPHWEAWLRDSTTRVQRIAIAGSGIAIAEMLNHARHWTLGAVASTENLAEPPGIHDVLLTVGDDRKYELALLAGWTISLVTAIVLVALLAKGGKGAGVNDSASLPD